MDVITTSSVESGTEIDNKATHESNTEFPSGRVNKVKTFENSSSERRFSPDLLTIFLNNFLSGGDVSEKCIDEALFLLRVSPVSLIDHDESAIVAVLLSAIENSRGNLTSKYLLLLSSLLSFTVSSKSLRLVMEYLISSNGTWRPHSYELIHQLKLATSFPNNMSFFVFPGENKSTMVLPPVPKFPYQYGWTFQCWVYVNPAPCKPAEIKPRYLFSFQTDKGLGYTGHFLGTLFIVTSCRSKGKELHHCVPTEFHPCRWYMLTLAFVYNRWTKSELRCYVNGKIVSSVDMSWPITSSESFDRCIIGGSITQSEENLFSGRIASITGFTEALSPQQISGLYTLGPNYKGQLRLESEVKGVLPESERKALIETKLSSSIMFTYHPSACDHNLCLDQSPQPNSVFVHPAHGIMQGNVKPVRTTSLQSAIRNLGGIQVLYVLMEQLDYAIDETSDSTKSSETNRQPFPLAALLFNLLFDLARTSVVLRAQLARTGGLVVLAQALLRSQQRQQTKAEASYSPLDDALLSALFEATRFLTRELLAAPRSAAAATMRTLLRQVFDKLLFAHPLWLSAPVKVQDRLYGFLADEFRVDLLGHPGKSIVASALHAIKSYFWITPPTELLTEVLPAERPPLEFLARIRSNILLFIRPLILQQYHLNPNVDGGATPSSDGEVEALFSFLVTVREPENLRDVLFYTAALMSQFPAVMVPQFDRHEGIQVVFQLLALSDEDSRLYALKLLAFFLKFSKPKRKQEAVNQHGVLNALYDHFVSASPIFTMKAYNVFFELLTEEVTLQLPATPLPQPNPSLRIENPALLKTIALLIIHSKRTPELMTIRQVFLEHLLSLCLNSDANRRAVLQMSVWQDWVVGLASLWPDSEQNSYATAAVVEVLRCLLFYALRREFGGWRVWIDTLAILHARIAFEHFLHTSAAAATTSNQQIRASKRRKDDSKASQHATTMATVVDSKFTSSTGAKKISVEEADLTDRAVRKLVGEMVNKLAGDADEPKETENKDDNSSAPNSTEFPANGEARKTEGGEAEQVSKQQDVKSSSQTSEKRVDSQAFRTPPFFWSYLHQVLLDGVLRSIEDEFHAIATANSHFYTKPNAAGKEKMESQKRRRVSGSPQGEDDVELGGLDEETAEGLAVAQLHDFVNDPANQIYVVNLIHLVSQLSDSLVTACGGLLPLLAATTSPTMELEVHETCSGLSIETAFGLLLRVANIADVVVFMPAASINLVALEKETGMNPGGILRQCLRLACLCAVRNCLEVRLRDFLPSPEVLAQLSPLPAPHHHCLYPFPPLTTSDQLHEKSVVDLADSASKEPTTTAASSQPAQSSVARGQRHPMTSFHFYEMLRHNMQVIYRLANPRAAARAHALHKSDGQTTSLSPECSAFLERLRLLPPNLQKLVMGLRPSMASYVPDYMGGIFDKTVAHPLVDMNSLLQNVDINRLHNVIYRDEEETRQTQFMALAVSYFLSVLMVSRYRDCLDPVDLLALCHHRHSKEGEKTAAPASPETSRLGSSASAVSLTAINPVEKSTDSAIAAEVTDTPFEKRASTPKPLESEAVVESNSSKGDKAENAQVKAAPTETFSEEPAGDQTLTDEPKNGREKGDSDKNGFQTVEDSAEEPKQTVATVHQTTPKATLPVPGEPAATSLGVSGHAESETPHLLSMASPRRAAAETNQRVPDLTGLLELTMGSAVPLLKEIFFDFEAFMAKTLVGSHGQDLLFAGGLNTMRSANLAVEIVMLLCSQEWQNSLQKHAGLAFIELVNECRLLTTASRDHLVSVAQEADFILARLRTAEVRRAGALRSAASRCHRRAIVAVQRGARLSAAGAARDCLRDTALLALTRHHLRLILEAPLPPPANVAKGTTAALMQKQMRLLLERFRPAQERVFYRLDTWEDDSRRRRRLVLDPFGSSHPEAVLHACVSPPAPLTAPPQLPASIDTDALNLRAQLEQASEQPPADDQPADKSQVGEEEEEEGGQAQPQKQSGSAGAESTLPPTPPGVPTEPGLVTGLVTAHQDEFEQMEISSSNPVVVSTSCQLIASGVAVHGTLTVTNAYFAFETDPTHSENQKIDPHVLAYTGNLYSRWSFGEVRAVFTRRHLLRNVALEIFLTSRTSVMFALPDEVLVRRVVYALPAVGVGVRYGVPQSYRASLAPGRQLLSLSQATARWQRREMSNFDYLMCLNTLAGRSFNDLNQYPIFPWVLSNYTSSSLDLNEPANYRDLSKPVGALDPKRKAFFDERYADWDDPTQPAFHYGTHYSTAAFVLNYLIRLEPFTTMFLNMQGGKFDHANRLFHSVEATWAGCLQSSTNVKELIPEFFYLPEMFENANGYDLGRLEDGTALGDVVLPPWASTPEEFVRIHRQALESELVSCQLHHWIDLIFGYKQRGPEAVKATNVFHYLTYEGSINWDKVKDPVIREALEGQIACFGQTPSQLLTTPHPARGSALAACPRLFAPPPRPLASRLRPSARSPLLRLAFSAAASSSGAETPLVAVGTNCVFSLNRWNKAAAAVAGFETGAVSKVISPPLMSPAQLQSPPPPQDLRSPGHPETPSSNFPVAAALPTSSPESHVTPLIYLDPTPLASSAAGNKRYVGENMDPSIRLSANNFVVTPDCRAIVVCGYSDHSFRIFSVDSGRCVTSVVGGGGHEDVVCCVGMSEATATGHCYLATGGRDALVCLWILNTRTLSVFFEPASVGCCGEGGGAPSPQVTLVGHQNTVQCVAVSAELGLVFSGSEGGVCLLHTTQGELLRRFETPPTAADRLRPCGALAAADGHQTASQPMRLAVSRHGYVIFQMTPAKLAVFTLNARLVAVSDLHRQMPSESDVEPTLESISGSEGNVVAATGLRESAAEAEKREEEEEEDEMDEGEEDFAVSALAVTRCANFLVVGGTDGAVRILRLYSLRQLATLAAPHPSTAGAITALEVSPDQRFIVAGLANGAMVVFNVNFNRWREDAQSVLSRQRQNPPLGPGSNHFPNNVVEKAKGGVRLESVHLDKKASPVVEEASPSDGVAGKTEEGLGAKEREDDCEVTAIQAEKTAISAVTACDSAANADKPNTGTA